MELKKWINNAVDATFKRIFNDNMDMISRGLSSSEQQLNAVNARVDNMIINSGGDSPNEVVDARVGVAGKIHPTLKARLDSEMGATEDTLLQNMTEIEVLQADAKKLREEVNRITANGDLELYVSVDGDDNWEGTLERPYRTIQAAVNSLPLITSSNIYIFVGSGVYHENVRVRGLIARDIIIQSHNTDVLDSRLGDTDVFVTSITFDSCNSLCRVSGVTFINPLAVDNAQSPFAGVSLLFRQCIYGLVQNCRFNQDSRSWDDFAAIFFSGTNGRVVTSWIANQRFAIAAGFLSNVGVTNTNQGENNRTVYRSSSSIIFAAFVPITGEQVAHFVSAGQLFLTTPPPIMELKESSEDEEPVEGEI